LEVAVQDAAGVRVAREIGAARVELAHGLALGGVTPSPATLELAVAAAGQDGPEVHVLVRPRAGGFHYDAEEVEATERDVRWMLAHGAAGVVIGAQTASGELDPRVLQRLRDAARSVRADAGVTLHRVIDVTPDPLAALRLVRELGFTRVLTSGAASAARDGLDTLRALVAAAEQRIQIMAGSGVTAANAAEIAAVGVDALHFSAKRMVLADGAVRMGSADEGVGGHEVTDLAQARAVRDALGL
jgi:copper homeostasis protein